MRSKFLLALTLIIVINASAQITVGPKNDSWKKIYRATESKINDLVHTKLDVKFDFDKAYMYGKAWITLKPHFYPTDTLTLDAKGMNINNVSMYKLGSNKKLNYTYDSLLLNIKLDRTYNRNESYTIFIDYTAKPNEFGAKGSQAITDAKGLYFINPKGTEKNKPTQIWTQGETEASSVWFPTIDKPNQKTTEEISMTVPAKYVTLSNGKLSSQKQNADGTRTDTWKMDLPHAPYLFFMGVGDFAIVKDSYKGKEVSYYVEKEYASVARKIFGGTPEMMKFFSNILGVEFPWVKYAQIVGRDYVSGAMENTTATLHQESAQQNARELTDGNRWESVIVHELFHQWFGDLVTSESWSNLTVNESFANYSEILWNQYKHGKDVADEHNYNEMQGYLRSRSEDKELVRYYYRDKEEMFDAVSYNKGGRILHMLRNIVGDSAFLKSLNLYLTTNKFKSAEAAQLRLAFEEVTGKDLHWFWNQWYYAAGHPKLDISYGYDNVTNTATVFVKQTQTGDKVFRLPFAIDIYNGSNKTRHNVWMENRTDTFRFTVSAKPDLINVDAEKILLAEKQDNKTLAEYAFQYANAKNYVDRRESIDFAIKNIDQPEAVALLQRALSDPFSKLRERALQYTRATEANETTINKIVSIATNDPSRTTKALAIDVLGQLKRADYQPLFVSAAKDSSYTLAGAGLEALLAIDEKAALQLVDQLKKDAKGRLQNAIETAEILKKGDADFTEVTNSFDSLSLFEKYSGGYRNYLLFLGNVNNTENFKKGLDKIVDFRKVMAGYSPEIKKYINNEILAVKQRKESLKKTTTNIDPLNDQINYIDKVVKD